jgi:diguanylate cyclase (GGDEF)-like protein
MNSDKADHEEEYPRKRRPIHEFENDPILDWANKIAADPTYEDEETFQYFLELRDHYKRLLKHFTQVTRLSDSYSQSLKEMTVTLNEQIRQDSLTGILNRRGMIEKLSNQLGRAKRYHEPFSIILVDIDLFKHINDDYGHQAGDQVLIAVAEQLKNDLREEDFCGRWGGEEFLICLPHTAVKGAKTVAEKLRTSVAELEIKHEHHTLQVTISLGITGYDDTCDLDDLVRIADNAMYRAKQEGRNRSVTL